MVGARYHCVGLRGVCGRPLRAALLAATAPVWASLPAAAQDATWLAAPVSGVYDSFRNWSGGAVPSGTATFGASHITSLSIPSNDEANRTNVGGWTFNAGAGNYTFANGQLLNFNGAGIAINGGSATILNGVSVNFRNSSTAGSAAITSTTGDVNFYNTSSAGNAAITDGYLNFYNTSTAGSAHITNHGDGGGDGGGIPGGSRSATAARPAAPPSPTTAQWISPTPARPEAPPSPTMGATPG
ncbi:hypothetical protein [Bradyrhizobium sp. 2TAF24]|uniref:hypothetical protein n=1 Tax=Bradyrhizobium sp. 2TAF24 TaxID=3233011 RepID=UPI003F92A431